MLYCLVEGEGSRKKKEEYMKKIKKKEVKKKKQARRTVHDERSREELLSGRPSKKRAAKKRKISDEKRRENLLKRLEYVPVGAPTIYTKELGEEICKRICAGESIRIICADEDMPNVGTVLRWALYAKGKPFEDFREMYEQSREIQAHLLFLEMMEIANNVPNVIVGNDRSDGARVAAEKLRIDAIQFYIGKVIPRTYGDKIDVTSGGKTIKQPRPVTINYTVPPEPEESGG